MWATRERMRIAPRIRAHAAALAPAVATLAVAAMSPMGAVAFADGPRPAGAAAGVYGGMTSDGWPVIAEVTRDGRLLKRIVGGIQLDCSQGGGYSFPSQWRGLRISPSGAFKASYTDTGVEDGVEVEVSESIAGKLNPARTRLTATWRASSTFRNPDGTVDVCESGALRVVVRQ
jgi:hypothetical protein